jgi:hypothetical protein
LHGWLSLLGASHSTSMLIGAPRLLSALLARKLARHGQLTKPTAEH